MYYNTVLLLRTKIIKLLLLFFWWHDNYYTDHLHACVLQLWHIHTTCHCITYYLNCIAIHGVIILWLFWWYIWIINLAHSNNTVQDCEHDLSIKLLRIMGFWKPSICRLFCSNQERFSTHHTVTSNVALSNLLTLPPVLIFFNNNSIT